MCYIVFYSTGSDDSDLRQVTLKSSRGIRRNTETNYKGNTSSRIDVQNDSPRQLENGHPASFGDMDNTNEHYFIRGDITRSNPPVTAGWDRNALAVLYTDQFPKPIATFGTNAPTKIA